MRRSPVLPALLIAAGLLIDCGDSKVNIDNVTAKNGNNTNAGSSPNANSTKMSANANKNTNTNKFLNKNANVNANTNANKSAANTTSNKNASTAKVADPDAEVWVNKRSGLYHCPGSKFYGKAKDGESMTLKEAERRGYHPAEGKVCQ